MYKNIPGRNFKKIISLSCNYSDLPDWIILKISHWNWTRPSIQFSNAEKRIETCIFPSALSFIRLGNLNDHILKQIGLMPILTTSHLHSVHSRTMTAMDKDKRHSDNEQRKLDLCSTQ